MARSCIFCLRRNVFLLEKVAPSFKFPPFLNTTQPTPNDIGSCAATSLLAMLNGTLRRDERVVMSLLNPDPSIPAVKGCPEGLESYKQAQLSLRSLRAQSESGTTQVLPVSSFICAASHCQLESCCSSVMQPGGSGGAQLTPTPACASGCGLSSSAST